jgi:hypothetical protein
MWLMRIEQQLASLIGLVAIQTLVRLPLSPHA